MSWISGSCQGDRDCQCYYEDCYFDPYEGYVCERWCRDRDGSCPGWDAGGFLYAEDCKTSGGGDGW